MPHVLLAGFLVVYGNVASVVRGGATPADPRLGLLLAALLVVAALTWARRAGLELADLGIRRAGLARSAGVGLLVALAAGGAALLFLHFPPLLGRAVSYAPIDALPRDALLWRALVWMPLDTALPEELAFRGALLGGLRQDLSARPAALLSAVVFMAWHVVVVVGTLNATNLAGEPLLLSLGLAGAFAAIFVGGLLFAALRLGTRNLAGSVVAHWAFNAVLLLGLGAQTG